MLRPGDSVNRYAHPARALLFLGWPSHMVSVTAQVIATAIS
ncbi:MAG: hypothetical protein U0401_08500 [Anaerolineae bacterium]